MDAPMRSKKNPGCDGGRLRLVVAQLSLFAAASPEALTVGYSSFSGAYLPLWIAVEEGLGKKYGLDLKAIYAGRIRPQQLLATGEVPFVMATGTGALTSHILGVKDQVIIMTTINRVNSAIFSRPEIKSAEELRGKTVATGRPWCVRRYHGALRAARKARFDARTAM
jgi:ABC-type nitrate/sulfonate/bicarbonate transport system substrate-binding protein